MSSGRTSLAILALATLVSAHVQINVRLTNIDQPHVNESTT